MGYGNVLEFYVPMELVNTFLRQIQESKFGTEVYYRSFVVRRVVQDHY